MGFKNIFS